MAYPELPPGDTFWRCPKCGNEDEFRASGTGHIECTRCGQVSTLEELLAAHRGAHPDATTEPAAAR